MTQETIFPEVVQAVNIREKIVRTYFSDGSIHDYDVAPLIKKGGVFSPLADPKLFRESLTVMNGTAAFDIGGTWDPTTCIDIDPEVLHQAPVPEREDI